MSLANEKRPEDLLTPEQVQEILQVSTSSVRSYIRSGALPAVRIGGERLVRVRRSDLDRFLIPIEVEKGGG